MSGGGNPGSGQLRLRESLEQLKQLQIKRVANPEGALHADFGPGPSDAEQLAALVLGEEAGLLRGRLDPDLRGEVLQRLALTDLARGSLSEAAVKLEDALGTPPRSPKAVAALHYNMFRTMAPGARDDPGLGERAAEHYRQAVQLDRSLAEFSSEYALIRVVSAEPRGALYHVRNPAGNDYLIRALDFQPEDPSVAEMLALEAQSLTDLNHPNLLKVLEYRQGRFRRPFLLLEFLDGVDLERATRNLLSGGRRPTIGGALFEMRQLFSALTYLHGQQPPWVLRTLNPRDILLTRGRGLQLTDYGLNDPATRNSGDDAMYLAPEVRAGRPAGPPADVYSLARLFCFLVSGGPDLIDGLEPPVAEILHIAVNTDPDQRFPDVETFRAALAGAAGRMTRLSLLCTEGPCTGRRYHFDRWQSFVIGRDPNADFSLSADGRLSRRHVQIEVRSAECRIRDLGSSNGTLINGKMRNEELLYDGDKVKVGDTLLAVEIDYPGQPRRQRKGSAAAPAGRAEPVEPVEADLDAPTPGTVITDPISDLMEESGPGGLDRLAPGRAAAAPVAETVTDTSLADLVEPMAVPPPPPPPVEVPASSRNGDSAEPGDSDETAAGAAPQR